MGLKIWVDDIRPRPDNYNCWLLSTDLAIATINENWDNIEILDLDHDAGHYQKYGGDYINILNWIEERVYTLNKPVNWLFKFHSANPVGIENMMKIVRKNGWRTL